MLSTPKKVVLVLILVAFSGMGTILISGMRNGPAVILSDAPESDQSGRPIEAQTSDGNVMPDAGSQGVERGRNGNENGPAGSVSSADAAAGKLENGAPTDGTIASNEIKGGQGGEIGGKGNVDKASISSIDHLVSFGYEKRTSRTIDTVIVHSSYDALGNDPYSVSGVIAEYKQNGVSPHYLIDRKGAVYRLVEDINVAYHAGVSKMPDGRTGVNAFSIGIEVIEKDTDSPTSAQYASLRSLIASLKSKYHIKYVLGHSDIAPGRKTDPWGFDWKELK